MKLIAEISANHNQDYENCLKLIKSAYEAGADLVKLQCYTADDICFKSEETIPSGPWKGSTLHDLYSKAQTPLEWFEPIFHYCYKEGIPVFSSVFDLKSLSMMKNLNAPLIKIASTEAFNGNLLKECILYDAVPLIISMGKVYDLYNYFCEFEKKFEQELRDRKKECPIYFCASDCTYINEEDHTIVRDLYLLTRHLITEPRYLMGYSHNSNFISFDMLKSLVFMDCDFLEIHFTEDKNTLDGDFSINAEVLRGIIPQIKKLESKKLISKPDNNINLRKIFFEIKRDICPPCMSIL